MMNTFLGKDEPCPSDGEVPSLASFLRFFDRGGSPGDPSFESSCNTAALFFGGVISTMGGAGETIIPISSSRHKIWAPVALTARSVAAAVNVVTNKDLLLSLYYLYTSTLPTSSSFSLSFLSLLISHCPPKPTPCDTQHILPQPARLPSCSTLTPLRSPPL